MKGSRNRRHHRDTRLWQVAGAVTALSLTGVAKASVDRSIPSRPVAPPDRACAVAPDAFPDASPSADCTSTWPPAGHDATAEPALAPLGTAAQLRPDPWFGVRAGPACPASLDAAHDAAMPSYCTAVAQSVIAARWSSDQESSDQDDAAPGFEVAEVDASGRAASTIEAQDVDQVMAASGVPAGLAAEAAPSRARAAFAPINPVGNGRSRQSDRMVSARASAPQKPGHVSSVRAPRPRQPERLSSSRAPELRQPDRVSSFQLPEPQQLKRAVSTRISEPRQSGRTAAARSVKPDEPDRTVDLQAFEPTGNGRMAGSGQTADAPPSAPSGPDRAVAAQAFGAGESGQTIDLPFSTPDLSARDGALSAARAGASKQAADPHCAAAIDEDLDSAMPAAYCMAPVQTVRAARPPNDPERTSTQHWRPDAGASEPSTCQASDDAGHDSAMPTYCTAATQTVIAARSPAAFPDIAARHPRSVGAAEATLDVTPASCDTTDDAIDTAMPSACGIAPAQAFAAEERPNPFGDAKVVAMNELAETRGGFETTDRGQTLRVSFGIERAVYVNGALVSTSTLALDGLNRLAEVGPPGSGTNARTAASTANVLVNGAGNAMSLSAAGLPAGALTLQNSLDNQQLGARTVVNAVVEGSSLLRATRLESMVREAAIGAVRR